MKAIASQLVSIGTIRGGGDIVAKKSKDENGIEVVKIYQREKKPLLLQAFFRLHDLCSKNYVNITMGFQKSITSDVMKNNEISTKLRETDTDNIKNDIGDYFLSGNTDVSKKDFFDFVFEKNFTLPEIKYQMPVLGSRLDSAFFKMYLEQLQYNDQGGVSSKDLDSLCAYYQSKEKYFSFQDNSKFSKIYNYIQENSINMAGELKASLNFLYNKVVCGPTTIPYADVKTELEAKLNMDDCKAVYKEQTNVDWNDEKDGSIVDFMLKNITNESYVLPATTRFLEAVFDNLNFGLMLADSNNKIIPCIETRLSQLFNETSNKYGYK